MVQHHSHICFDLVLHPMAASLGPVASLRGWLLANNAENATETMADTSRGSGSSDDTASTVAFDGDGVGASPWDDWEVVDADIPVEMEADAAPLNPPSVAASASHGEDVNSGALDGVIHVGRKAAQAKRTRATCLLDSHALASFFVIY